MSDDDDKHVLEVGQRVALFGRILQEGAGGHEWFVRLDSEGSYPPELWVQSEALFHDRRPAQPSDTVVELNKRITALQMKLERVRDLVQNEYPHARAALLRILQGDE